MDFFENTKNCVLLLLHLILIFFFWVHRQPTIVLSRWLVSFLDLQGLEELLALIDDFFKKSGNRFIYFSFKIFLDLLNSWQFTLVFDFNSINVPAKEDKKKEEAAILHFTILSLKALMNNKV